MIRVHKRKCSGGSNMDRVLRTCAKPSPNDSSVYVKYNVLTFVCKLPSYILVIPRVSTTPRVFITHRGYSGSMWTRTRCGDGFRGCGCGVAISDPFWTRAYP